jgi:actin cytoskeleton-regulatory complex protein SLA1
LLGVDPQEQLLYFLDFETKEIVTKTKLSEITKAKDKKTKIVLEFGKDSVHEFEGERVDIKSLMEALEKAQKV